MGNDVQHKFNNGITTEVVVPNRTEILLTLQNKEYEIQENNGKFLPDLHYSFAQWTIWEKIQSHCTSLSNCPHPRNQFKYEWNAMRRKSRLNWCYARLMKLAYLLMEHLNILFSPCCGTLIGIIRHHDLIPHDHDVDFSVN